MHQEKLIKVMHEKSWTKTEIKKATVVLDKAKKKENKGENLFNYWSNIFFLIVVIIVTSISLTPLLKITTGSFTIIIVIIIGLIFGTLASHAILSLEDFNEKHHRIWGNIILFFALLAISYTALHASFYLFTINASALKYAIIYKISFIIFPAIVTIKHEIEINKTLNKIKIKIKKE